MRIVLAGLMLLLPLSAAVTTAQTKDPAADNVATSDPPMETFYPPAPAGEVRHKILLPDVPDPSLMRVELYAGQMRAMKMCDTQLAYEFGYAEQALSYRFKIGDLGKSYVACIDLDGERFARTGSEFVPYYPAGVLVYMPIGYELRYRIWGPPTAEGAAERLGN